MALERKKTLNVFKDARCAWGSYDDFPVGAKGTDPMPYLSRNRVAQPFFLVSAEDQVIIQMSGEGHIELQETAPERFELGPGDTVYIPAGVPSRLVPRGENIQIRLKADPPGREAVAWYCGRCGELVRATELGEGVLQSQYWHAVQAFNAEPSARTCGTCAEVHPPAELGDIAWLDVAAAIRAED
jgi:3-hydroxyanthranilate 3,4-dioxygenase